MWKCVNCNETFETKEKAKKHWAETENFDAPFDDIMKEMK